MLCVGFTMRAMGVMVTARKKAKEMLRIATAPSINPRTMSATHF